MDQKQYHHGDLKNTLIQAGMEILAQAGLSTLSLRGVASRAGVSHSAPYAHFNNKQDLIAAISTEGFRRLHRDLSAAAAITPDNLVNRMIEVGWAYVQFALGNSALFKIMFSGILENEGLYPEFVEASRGNFLQLVQLVKECQLGALLRPGSAEMLAISIWSLVHGFVSLLMEKQIPHTVLNTASLKELLCQTLNQITITRINPPNS